MILICLLLIASLSPAQISTNWTVRPLSSVYAMYPPGACMKSDHATIDNVNGYLLITGEVLTQTCHDQNLNGTTRNGPFTLPYTGAEMFTTSFNFTYGTIEYRAKFPVVHGSWPIIWMLGAPCQSSYPFTTDNVGTCNWNVPPSDEIDLTEYISGVYGTGIHSSLGSTSCAPSGDAVPTWHIYQNIWSAGLMVFKRDGVTVCTLTTAVPSTPMFIIIDFLMASTAGSVTPADFPQVFSVDYIKVTQGSTVIFDDEFNPQVGSSLSGAATILGNTSLQ